MQCPSCGDALAERTRAGVAIDICDGCQGVWLDRGELDKLLDREQRRNDRRDEDGDRDDGDADGPGGLLQNLIELFGR